MELGSCNLNFIYASNETKERIGKLYKDYKHNASSWDWQKKREAEEELRKYGLIGF